MANPAPPVASYAAMHTRAGFADGAVLTTAELDQACAYLVAQDGSGNAQELISLRVGTKGFIFGSTTTQLWAAMNAYTIDNGANWYPFDESAASFATQYGVLGIFHKYSPAMGGDGALTWQTVATVNQFGSVPWQTSVTDIAATGNTSITPGNLINAYKDSAALGADRDCTVHSANAYDGMEVEYSRNGSSGGFNRKLRQDDGTTLIKNVADNFTAKLRYHSGAWYLAGYYACS